MITIQSVVKDILRNDIEARTALVAGYMNYSQYAKKIREEVEERSKKSVTKESIIMALSRIAQDADMHIPTLIPDDIIINNITTKSPLTELAYEKDASMRASMQKLFSEVVPGADDFLTISHGTNEINITCSDNLVERVMQQFATEPIVRVPDLAALGVSINEQYYEMPGITYSFLKRIASRDIPLAETVSSRTEIIFTFHKRHLAEMIELFN